MGLMEEIEKEIVKSGLPKWKKLKEFNAEIEKMIENNITIDKQIELVIKYKIIDKIDKKEYTDIIKKHFGYTGRNKTKEKKASPPVQQKKQNNNISIEDKLSQDVDLMSFKKTLADKKG